MPDVTLEQIAARNTPGVFPRDREAVLAAAVIETRNLVIGLGIDTTEETERLDAHVSALEDARPEHIDWPATAREWERIAGEIRREREEWKRAAAQLADERDALEQQLADSRAALAKIVALTDSDDTTWGVANRAVAIARMQLNANATATTSEEREA